MFSRFEGKGHSVILCCRTSPVTPDLLNSFLLLWKTQSLAVLALYYFREIFLLIDSFMCLTVFLTMYHGTEKFFLIRQFKINSSLRGL